MSRERRVRALEQHRLSGPGLEAEIQRGIDASRPEIATYAKRAGVSVAVFENEVRTIQRRIAQIGRTAFDAEVAAELGIPVEDVADVEAMGRHIDRMDR